MKFELQLILTLNLLLLDLPLNSIKRLMGLYYWEMGAAVVKIKTLLEVVSERLTTLF